MKIHGTDELLKGLPAGNRLTPSPPADGGFGEIFKQTLDQASTADALPAASAASPLRPVAPMAESSVARSLDGYLDLLDEYRQKLSNPRVSLKGLESTVQRLEQRTDALAPMLGSLSEHNELREILNRALITASLEIIRFRRGDYLPD